MDPNDKITPQDPPDSQPELPLDDTDAVIEAMAADGIEVTDEPVVAAEPEQPETTEAKPEGEAPDPDKPAEEKPADAKPEKPVEPEKDEAVEKEIGDLRLKDKAAERFRELTGQVKELAPLREQLEKAGIKDVADLPAVVQKAQFADEHLAMVKETGATSEQYGQTLDYLSLVNKAATGDVAAAEKAYEMLLPELQALAGVLGKEIQGVVDPLAQHADLAGDVEAGDMTRARALELAAARTRQAQGQHMQAQAQGKIQQEQAVEQGRQALNAWDAQMAADPAYIARREQLSQIVGFIRQSLPPSQWLAATQQAYATLPPPAAPAPARPPVGAVPVRPTGLRAPLERAEFDDPVEAAMAGIRAAS